VKLRDKTFLALAVMIVTLGLSVFLTIRIFYDRSVAAVERGEAEDAVRRLGLLVDEDLCQLEILCRDWAYWDDSYAFAAGIKGDYLAVNLGEGQTIELLELSGMVICDEAGTILYRYETTPGLVDLMLELGKQGVKKTLLESPSGLVALRNETHLVTEASILMSDLSGPPRGIIAMARPVNGDRLERYARIVGRTVTIEPVPPGEANTRETTGRITLELGDEEVRSSVDLPGLGGSSAIRLSITAPTISARYGMARFMTLSMIVLVIITVIGTLIVLLLEGTLLGRMRIIGKDLERLATTNDRKTRIAVRGSDELSALCAAMNASLDRLDSMIDEREAMLHEINHRVKNNLQVINSMLSLQASSAKSPETLAAFDRSRHRLQAIAVVHDDALEHANIERIDLIGLIQRISSSLASTDMAGARPEIRLGGEPVEVGMDLALPLALISSEIIHNALAHAFVNAIHGLVTVRVGTSEGPSVVLEIRDNGIGIPPADAREHGLGISLVEALVLQLRGRFSIKSAPEGGTVFTLEAPLG